MRHSVLFQPQRWRAMVMAVVLTGLSCIWPAPGTRASSPAAQASTEVAADATPSIQQVQPAQATAGVTVDVEIDGANFASDAYVSCSSPEVHVVKTTRVSATRIDAQLAVLTKAQPGAVTLYVTNPSGSVAQTTFTIVVPASSTNTPAAAATTTASSQAPSGAEEAASGAGSPEVTSVEPASVTPGSRLTVKIKGKHFAQGTRASFSNPGIQVLSNKVQKSSQLAVEIQVASDAGTGGGSVFVVNPDDSEVEAHFSVTAGSPVVAATSESQPATASASSSGTASGSDTESGSANQKGSQQFEVYSLGNLKGILGGGSQTKGTLTLSSGKLKYTEGDQQVFAATRKDVKEIGANAFLGVNTGTFHVMLNSGKTYNFMASSFRPADSQSIVDALLKALQ